MQQPGEEARVAIGSVPSEDDPFGRAFRSEYPDVYRLVFRIVGARAEAEDIAQEVFLRLHRSLGTGGSDGKLPAGAPIRPWLFRVAMNLAWNERRDRKRLRARHERSHAEGASFALASDPHETLQREEERSAVRAILSALPERQAKVLLLRHSGLSYREVAAALEVAPGSVGTLLARAEEAFEEAYRRRFAARPSPPMGPTT